jgi:ATP-dependent Clp protease adapter protein ClpS
MAPFVSVLALLFLAMLVSLLAVFARRRELRRDQKHPELDAVTTFARVLAGRTGAARIELVHLALSVAGGPDGRARFAARGLDATRFAAAVRAEPVAPASGPSTDPAPSEAVIRVLQMARRRRARGGPVDRLIDVLRAQPDLARWFEAALAPQGPSDSLLPPDPSDVVFRNDAVTTMVIVVDILKEVFKLDELDAIRAMLFVHFTESGRLGPYSLEDAERLAARAVAIARERGAPLRVDVEPHPEVPLAWSE